MVAVNILIPEDVIIKGILCRESGWCVLYMCKKIMFEPATTHYHKRRRYLYTLAPVFMAGDVDGWDPVVGIVGRRLVAS